MRTSKVIKVNIVAVIISVIMILAVCCYMAVLWFYPVNYFDIINKNAKKYDLDPIFIASVIHAESKFRVLAHSNKDAKGLMQLTTRTAEWAATEIGLEDYTEDSVFEPQINIELGSWYLSRLLNQYDGDYVLALSAYNAGSGNVSKWLGDENYSKDGESLYYIPFPETRNYIERVEFNTKVYEFLMMLPPRCFNSSLME